ncbi:hypothetical protein NI17_024045 (plasmid) [Thermobifida halotolerans]|uniref:Uncharacterized protein n=1 Tax=Thermobifida halotolerans TaxID=483545 RepID=A0AA97M6I2_9ACTN|nr:hypothetical protein [Thermobifida halotolerans]UOE22286.1 hypothetical protein NI17_024045 [Thermobifida halotolerans]
MNRHHCPTSIPSPVALWAAAVVHDECPKGGDHAWLTSGTLTSCSRCGKIRW